MKDRSKISCTFLDNPSRFPDPAQIEQPYVRLKILTPERFLGTILELLQQRRGEYREMEFFADGRVAVHYDVPLAEIATDFYDKLKARSQGYASMDYEPMGYRPSDLVKLDILVNREPVDALSVIVHRERAYYVGRLICQKLAEGRAQAPRGHREGRSPSRSVLSSLGAQRVI